MAAPDLSAVFRQPFPQQVAAFRLRLGNLVPTSRWDDLRGAEHDRAFMVAGAVKADLLADLAAAVDRAIVEGTGFRAFQRDFRDIVERRGWHGWTGEGSAAGEAWRMRVIYRTNMAVSYAAGRRAQLVEGRLPYWVYRHGGSADPRLHHLAWDGLVLPADHPFWATHFPPNGWGCSCRVVGAGSLKTARLVGGDPDKVLPANWAEIDPRTGAKRGIDRGWDYAPGASTSDAIRALARKPVDWPYEIAKAYLESLPAETADALATGMRALPELRTELRRYAERVAGERGGAPIDPRVLVQPARTLGPPTGDQAAEAARLLGLDLAGFDFALDPEGVTAILARRTDGSKDLPGITPARFALLAALLNGAPTLAASDGALSVTGELGGVLWRAVFVPDPNRRMLRLVDFIPVRRTQ